MNIIKYGFVFVLFFLISGCADVPTYQSVINISTNYPIYPDPNMTPGDVMETNVTKICEVNYTAKVRDVSESQKENVYHMYGIYSRKPYEYEVDHLINLGIGGSNDISNLWPQPYDLDMGARQKDVVENYLRKEVCAGRMDLAFAQQQIVSNWTGIYLWLKR